MRRALRLTYRSGLDSTRPLTPDVRSLMDATSNAKGAGAVWRAIPGTENVAEMMISAR